MPKLVIQRTGEDRFRWMAEVGGQVMEFEEIVINTPCKLNASGDIEASGLLRLEDQTLIISEF